MMTQTAEAKNSKPSKLEVIWFFLKPYKLYVLSLIILALLISFLEISTVAAIYPVVSLGLNLEAGQSNALLSIIASIAGLLHFKDIFVSYCILVILLAIVGFVIKLINFLRRQNLDIW